MRSCLLEYHDEKNITLDDLLSKNNLLKIKELLCGIQSSFIDRISVMDLVVAKEIWLITYKKYLLELLKSEYNQSIQQIHKDNNFLIKANELRQAMEILIKDIILREDSLSRE